MNTPMHDDKDMAVDPVFDEVVKAFFGDGVDSRPMWDTVSKFSPDPSEVHVRGAGHITTKKEAKRQKRQAQIGLASNVVGLAAGTTALIAAAKDDRFGPEKNPTGGRISHGFHRLGQKLPNITPKTGRRGALVATGALGLQAANTGGDLIANRVLNREAKKDVKKSYEAVIQARRDGLITSEQAVDIIVKGLRMPFRKPKLYNNSSAIPSGRKSVLVGTGVLSAVGAGTFGYKKGKRDTLNALANPVEEPKKPVNKSITWTGEISKVDSDKRQVFGWCSITEMDGQPVVDLQGDYVSIDEIEKAAYTYVIDSRKGGDMHQRDGENPLHVANLVESFVVTPEKLEKMGLEPDALPHGWWVGFKVDDDTTWNRVKSGERTGFSIHGKGSRVEKMLEA